ncbi:hypothetical protein A4R35_01585 [Thermogemmatispora tikiterensis]|uniref:Uncharacterized protein n=1 Tax=Thermogemmatispora tikiterensis TaxID=1825093 RepID=A0A328V983_9CHLR|nr:hypothetical protein A4R35_01585 [Thermogemmatispora tikiterensis]
MNRKRYPLVTQADVEQVKNELILGANALDESSLGRRAEGRASKRSAVPAYRACFPLLFLSIQRKVAYT